MNYIPTQQYYIIEKYSKEDVIIQCQRSKELLTDAIFLKESNNQLDNEYWYLKGKYEAYDLITKYLL